MGKINLLLCDRVINNSNIKFLTNLNDNTLFFIRKVSRGMIFESTVMWNEMHT